MTSEELVRNARLNLEKSGVPEAELNAWYLFEKAYRETSGLPGINKAWLHTHGDEEASEELVSCLDIFVNHRSKGVPLEYITHETEFMGLPFYVDFSVLIPRQDTECLVEECLKHCEGKTVLDMCTGSGCIGISLAKLGNCKSVTVSDISDEALNAAKKNAEINDTEVSIVNSDFWNNIHEKYDIITCNPPYIKKDIIPTLMREVKDYEPVLALDGGEDGLEKYRIIIDRMPEFLSGNGRVFFEIGYDQGRDVSELLSGVGLSEIRVIKDLAGLDRVVTGVYSEAKDNV
ncbi:MAG: peptide chain release factor N(5)-glutamine methyltransferase [Eubacterium sp.]|nr:peptide chain release factor N(5)-glutamine methyltransferase [Eubacterium sp.]